MQLVAGEIHGDATHVVHRVHEETEKHARMLMVGRETGVGRLYSLEEIQRQGRFGAAELHDGSRAGNVGHNGIAGATLHS